MFIPQRQLGSCSVTRPFPLSLHPSSPSLFLSCPVKHTVCSEKLAGVRIANFIAPPPNANTVNLQRIDVTLSSVLNATESHHFTSSDTNHYSEYFNISVPESSGPRTYSVMYRVSPNLRAWKRGWTGEGKDLYKSIRTGNLSKSVYITPVVRANYWTLLKIEHWSRAHLATLTKWLISMQRAQYVLLFLVLRSYSSHPFLGSWRDCIEVQLSSQMLQYTILSPCRELLVCFSNMLNKSMENGR